MSPLLQRNQFTQSHVTQVKSSPKLCGYFLALESQLRGAGTRFSSRRMTILLRTSLGIHASRIALCIESGRACPKPEWQESLFLALAHGHPGLASGQWIVERYLPCTGRPGTSQG
jgi:hypothetical protein